MRRTWHENTAGG